MQSQSTLSSLFARILGNYTKIKNFEMVSTDDKFKDLIQESCAICQEAIQMINQLELFSKNESLEDLSTQSIRYLTLPAFLAFFNEQKPDREERLNALKLAQTYYDEFMELVESYGIPDLPKRLTAHDFSGDSATLKSKSSAVRRDPNIVREEKIRAYKAKKALEQSLEKFLSLDSPHTDDEVLPSTLRNWLPELVCIKRDESVALVRYWAYTAVEELKLIDEEVAILSRFPEPQGPSSPPPPPKSRQPPLLITREKIRAAVFGAGYPSLPTMTLDQFVELQVQQGLMPPPQSVKDEFNSKEGTWRRVDPSETTEPKQEAEKRAAREDALEDSYSEEQRTKARNFDEFKDEHRRGSGNRANRA